jgi:hypothetical protein
MKRLVWSLLVLSIVRSAEAGDCEYPIQGQCDAPTPRSGFVPGQNGCGPASNFSDALRSDDMASELAEALKNAAQSSVVPNTYPEKADVFTRAFYGSADFEGPCNGHDVCYGTCNANKSNCDSNLMDAMLVECEKAFPNDTTSGVVQHLHQNCRWRAAFYRAVLTEHGQAPFKAGQAEACECCRMPMKEPTNEPTGEAGAAGAGSTDVPMIGAGGEDGAGAVDAQDEPSGTLIQSALSNAILLANGDVWVYALQKVVANVPDSVRAVPVVLTNGGYVSVLRKDGTVVDVAKFESQIIEVRPVENVANVTKIASGFSYGCGILDDGKLLCWDPAHKSIVVPGLSKVTQVSVSTGHACVIVEGGAVKCWGDNSGHQIGISLAQSFAMQLPTSVTAPDTQPIDVPGISTAVSIAAGGECSCAALANGTVSCWGRCFDSQTYGFQVSVAPLEVKGLQNVKRVYLGYGGGASGPAACAILNDATVSCWGVAPVGDGLPHSWSPPIAVPALSGVLGLTVGNEVFARLADDTVRHWSFSTKPTLVFDARK